MRRVNDDSIFEEVTLNKWILSLKLPKSETLVLAFIIKCTRLDGGYFNTIKYLSRIIGSPERTLYRSIEALISLGYIEKCYYYESDKRFVCYKSIN